MKIPNSARYNYVNEKVFNFLISENITEFPLNPFEIIKQNKWGIVKYSEIMKEFNCNLDTVIKILKSHDAYTQYDGNNYTITYNDLIDYPDRILFTLMHEIGHIYLGHLIDFEETTIYRNNLVRKKYKVLENEANAFSRNSLAPEPLITNLKSKKIYIIKKIFNISNKAAETRLRFLKEDSKINNQLNISQKICNQFKNFMYKKYCNYCEYFFISKTAKFCPICGNNNLKWKNGDDFMKYDDGYELDNNGKAKKCPICDNEEVHYGEYCIICGAYLINKCTYKEYDFNGNVTDECNTIAKRNARYCYKCGRKTTFLEKGYLREWNEPDNSSNNSNENTFSFDYTDDDLPF